jgi:signal peptidase
MRIKLYGSTETLFYIFLGIFLAFGINVVLGQALATDMPVVAVESNSMVPTFHQGDILIIHGVRDPDDYLDVLEVGDIIVFSVKGREVPIVHRIKEINPDNSYQTQGDASSGQHAFEKHIDPEQIHGKVVTIVPYLGWVKIGMTEYVWPFVTQNLLMVITVALIIAGAYIYIFNIQRI